MYLMIFLIIFTVFQVSSLSNNDIFEIAVGFSMFEYMAWLLASYFGRQSIEEVQLEKIKPANTLLYTSVLF